MTAIAAPGMPRGSCRGARYSEGPPQLDEGEALQEIGQHGAEHRHVEQNAADKRSCPFAAHAEPDGQHHGKTDQRACDDGDVRRLVLAMGQREDLREITCARQRIDLAARGEDDGMEGGDEADHGRERQRAGASSPKMARKPSNIGSPEVPSAKRRDRRRRATGVGDLSLDGNRRVDDEDQKSQHDEREHAEHDALRHVAARIDRFLRGERKLLDGKEKPHGKRHRGEDPVKAEGKEWTISLGQLDAFAVDGSTPMLSAYRAKSMKRRSRSLKRRRGRQSQARSRRR